jgi:TROVE domain protein
MPLTDAGWKAIFDISTWQQIRMNLATFNRHNVFNDFSYVNKAYERLTSRDDILRSKVMPYSVFSAYLNSGDIPTRIKEALNTAVQISLENIPKINGKTVIAIDYSGSMDWRLNSKGSVRYIDIAAVFTAAIKFRNPNAEIVLFNTRARDYTVDPGTTVMQLADSLSRLEDGGTDCSSAFKHIYDKGRYNGMPDNIIMISDNQSWLGFRGNGFRTGTQKIFDDIRQINPRARLVNIDISPSSSSQTSPSENVLNISGFNDTVFKIVSDFFESNGSKTFWVDKIKAIEI